MNAATKTADRVITISFPSSQDSMMAPLARPRTV
jgi:hypothetical protein